MQHPAMPFFGAGVPAIIENSRLELDPLLMKGPMTLLTSNRGTPCFWNI